jgi:5-methylcytosine-specific restriction endonuclease McrA
MQVPDSPREIFAQRVHALKEGLKTAGITILEILGALAQAAEEYQNTPIPCRRCGTMVLRKKTARYTPSFDLPKGFPHPYGWCPACVAKLQKDIAEYWRMGREERIVYMECERARERGLSASLTLQEWEQTKKQFKEHWGTDTDCCAYCGGPYEALDHFVPIVSGGGTIAGNCVPACKRCNSSKGGLHPDEIRETVRSPEAIRRVRTSLAQLQIPVSSQISVIPVLPEDSGDGEGSLNQG